MITKANQLLELRFLGTPQLRLSGQALTEQISGKPLALFAYLAVTSRSHTRDLLADLLWSELNNQQARNNLRYLLPDLRQVVGDYLIITPQSIGFNRQARYWLDVEALRTMLAARPTEFSTQTLQTVLDLYQGEFLAGFTVRNAPVFEEWVMRQREELHTLALQGFYTLAERYHQQGEIQAGLATTQRLLHWEPWHEAGHRLQMQLLAGSGQRSAALAQYALCRHILADELGVEPDTATTALYEQIRSGGYDKVTRGQDDKMAESFRHPVILPSLHPVILSPPPHNLPSQLTSFFGREQEVADLCVQLHKEEYRLITLVGEGGIGKTRLALAVAQSILDFGFWVLDLNQSTMSPPNNQKSKIKNKKFPDGVWLVPLGGITAIGDCTDQLAEAVAKAIQLQFSGTQPLLTQLLTYLHNKRLLLLFDNAEHLLPGVADFLAQLLQGSPHTTALVTSRHLLNLQAEFVWRVMGLPVPTDEELRALTSTGLMAYSSLALFGERARRANRGFRVTTENQAEIVAICRLVQGLPLAVELAAALTTQYTCAELYAALQRDYTILASTGADPSSKHRSIQAMLDYSWRFLLLDEAQTLAACSVFAGSFTFAAATAITGAPLAVLNKLVDQSLLQVREGRFSMHELVRHYAAAQLGQTPERQRIGLAHHAAYYMGLLHGLETALMVNVEAQDTVQRDLDNIRMAWLWSVAQVNQALLEMGVEGLQCFYQLAGLYGEVIHLLDTAQTAVRQAVAASPLASQPPRLLARLLCHTAQFYRRSGQVEKGEILVKEALELGRQMADPMLQGLAYHEWSRLAQVTGDFTTMHTLAEQACRQARLASLPHLTAESLNDLGIAVGLSMGPLDAIPHFHEALHCLQQAPNRNLEARSVSNLGFFHLACHEYQSACQYLLQALTLKRLLPNREGNVIALIHLGDLWMALGAYPEAKQAYDQALALVQTMHAPYWESWLHASCGRLQHLCGDPAAAHTACTFARQIAQRSGIHVQEQWSLVYLGHALMDLDDRVATRDCYQQAIALQKQAHWVYRTVDAHAGLAALFLTQNEVAPALVHAETALALLAQQGLAAANEPFEVYWTCVRVLKANGDPRAVEVLGTAYQTLQEIAGTLEDNALRRSFLKNVAVNGNLIAAAQATGIV